MKKFIKLLSLVIILIIALSKLNVLNNIKNITHGAEPKGSDSMSYIVKYVIDGDTFVINYQGKDRKVRLIGIDTPESVHEDKKRNTHEGKIASDYTKKRLEGKEVRLEFDVKKFDDYGRLLAYCYFNDKLYNIELLEIGYAKTYTLPPNVKYSKEFKEVQRKAIKNKVGFWK